MPDLQDTCVLITEDWDEIYALVAAKNRQATCNRKTSETEIQVSIELDGNGTSEHNNRTWIFSTICSTRLPVIPDAI